MLPRELSKLRGDTWTVDNGLGDFALDQFLGLDEREAVLRGG